MPAALSTLTIRAMNVRPVRVPMRRPLVTSRGTIAAAPLILVDLVMAEGITGRAYILCYYDRLVGAMCRILEESFALIDGEPAAPRTIASLMERAYTIPGWEGLVSNTLSAIDVACWDALAQAAGLPLVRLLGAQPRPIPAYNSNGLSLADPERLGDEARQLLDDGFRAIKLRLGYPSLDDDLRAVHIVREAVGAETTVMSDYNQALSVNEALMRGRALDREGLAWIEEPVRHDDYDGCARLTAEFRTPIQLGENFLGPRPLASAIAARASAYVMFDLMRINGVTGWLSADAIARAAGIPVSSHLFPEVSVHLLAASPASHWLEYVDWANPILAEPLTLSGGTASPSEIPGTGIRWNNDAIARYAM